MTSIVPAPSLVMPDENPYSEIMPTALVKKKKNNTNIKQT